MHKYYYTYKITLLKGSLAGHYYYGQHSTNDLNDDYIGSGTILKKYYKKYGALEGDTYIKEILAFFNNLCDLNTAEYELIGDKYINDELCLNLRAGGMKPGFSEESRELCRINHKGGTKGKHWKLSEKSKQNISNAVKGKTQTKEHIEKRILNKINNGNSKHSEKTKKKISESKKGKHRVYNDDGTYKMM
jgi:hypothetical protein